MHRRQSDPLQERQAAEICLLSISHWLTINLSLAIRFLVGHEPLLFATIEHHQPPQTISTNHSWWSFLTTDYYSSPLLFNDYYQALLSLWLLVITYWPLLFPSMTGGTIDHQYPSSTRFTIIHHDYSLLFNCWVHITSYDNICGFNHWKMVGYHWNFLFQTGRYLFVWNYCHLPRFSSIRQ